MLELERAGRNDLVVRIRMREGLEELAVGATFLHQVDLPLDDEEHEQQVNLIGDQPVDGPAELLVDHARRHVPLRERQAQSDELVSVDIL